MRPSQSSAPSTAGASMLGLPPTLQDTPGPALTQGTPCGSQPMSTCQQQERHSLRQAGPSRVQSNLPPAQPVQHQTLSSVLAEAQAPVAAPRKPWLASLREHVSARQAGAAQRHAQNRPAQAVHADHPHSTQAEMPVQPRPSAATAADQRLQASQAPSQASLADRIRASVQPNTSVQAGGAATHRHPDRGNAPGFRVPDNASGVSLARRVGEQTTD